MENKINFVRKIKLRIINDDKDFKNQQYQRLRNIQYHTWKLANKIVQGQFFLKILPDAILFKYPDQFKRYKEIQGRLTEIGMIKKKNLDDATIKEKSLLYEEINQMKKDHEDEFKSFIHDKSIQNYTYASNADEYRDIIPSNIRSSINSKVIQDFNVKYKTFQNGSTSIQTYKRTIPVPFQKNAILDLKRNENNEFQFKMFDIEFACLLGKDGNNTTYILNDLINQSNPDYLKNNPNYIPQFKMNDSAYMFENGNIFLLLNCSTTQTKTKKNPNIIAAIDLGISRMATMVIRDITDNSTKSYIERKFYGDDSFMKKAMFYQNKKSNINRSLISKTGKGRLHSINKKNKVLAKFSNFRDSFNKKIAHAIIQRCIANNVSEIVMEELSGIGESNHFMKNWPYFDLQLKIINKAKEYGIPISKINPAYTSQTCPQCGHTDNENRMVQAHFECVKCNYKNNSDVVSGINQINHHKQIRILKKRIENNFV